MIGPIIVMGMGVAAIALIVVMLVYDVWKEWKEIDPRRTRNPAPGHSHHHHVEDQEPPRQGEDGVYRLRRARCDCQGRRGPQHVLLEHDRKRRACRGGLVIILAAFVAAYIARKGWKK